MERGKETDLGYILRLIFQFLDLSRDVERNKDDGVFRDDGGTIVYVFDANVFEIFIDPTDARARVASLHSDMWFRGNIGEASAKPYVAQNALSTAEYLAGGALPGQKFKRIYMTTEHRWELARRLETIKPKLVQALGQVSEQDVFARFDKVKDLLSEFDKKEGQIPRNLVDKVLFDDIEKFKQLGVPTEDLRSYVSTRAALAALASDNIVEPAEQLSRLVTDPLRSQFHTLHLRYSITETQQEDLILDARRWFRDLRAECINRGIEVIDGPRNEEAGTHDKASRTRGALWADAQSLALVRWAAVQAPPLERVVFVTADQLMFDTYRRWYANLSPGHPEYAEPFVLRRITQYAPVFNLIDSGKANGERYRVLFRNLLEVLEVTLLPLNLSRLRSRAAESVLTRMRELTALRLTKEEPIEQDPLFKGLVDVLRHEGIGEQHRNEITTILSNWRELERAALGLADAQVSKRIREMERRFAGIRLGQRDEASHEAFVRYIGGLVENLRKGSLELWLPLARDFIDNWRPPTGSEITRAPIALRLELELTDRTVHLGPLLDERLKTQSRDPLFPDSTWEELYHKPEVVFAIAAVLGFSSRDWSNAHHFAEIALQTERDRSGGHAGPMSSHGAEIRYLSALAKRFRMGDIGPPLSSDAFDRVQRYYNHALELLDQCIQYHDRVVLGPQRLRITRALSERAALHLFYAGILNPTVRHSAMERRTRSPSRGGKPDMTGLLDFDADSAAIKALDLAENDLCRCIEQDRYVPERSDQARADFRVRLQRQYYSNIAALGVLRALWRQTNVGDPLLRPTSREAVEKVTAILDRYGDTAHPLMTTMSLAFLALGGDTAARNKLRSMRSPKQDAGILNFDLALMDTVLDHVNELSEAAVSSPG